MSQLIINLDQPVKTPNRVQANWSNLSTIGKVATVAVTIALLGAGVAAFILGGPLLTGLLHLTPEASALILNATVATLGFLGLAPACTLLKKAKTNEASTPSVLTNVWDKTKAAVVNQTHAFAAGVVHQTHVFVVGVEKRLAAWRHKH